MSSEAADAGHPSAASLSKTSSCKPTGAGHPSVALPRTSLRKATDADKNGTIEVAEFIAKLETEWDVAGPVRITPQNSSHKKL